MKQHKTMKDYFGLGVITASAAIGLSIPLFVYMLLEGASQEVRLVLIGGLVFGTFAIVYRLIESRVQISKERAEAYRDAVAIARELYRPLSNGHSSAIIGSAEEFERLFMSGGNHGP
jgi:hypothetical protein